MIARNFNLARRGQLGPPASALVASRPSSPSTMMASRPLVSQVTGATHEPAASMPCSTPLSQLPGDPSLVVYTNVDMGDKKSAFMVAASSAVAQCLGKPESYVSVCVLDKQDMIFGGNDSPCALAQLNSLGAIELENNRMFSAAFADLISEHDIPVIT